MSIHKVGQWMSIHKLGQWMSIPRGDAALSDRLTVEDMGVALVKKFRKRMAKVS